MCYISTKYFQLFEFVFPTERYTTQNFSMLDLLKSYSNFLEYHNRLLYHDIAFTLPCGQLDCSDYISLNHIKWFFSDEIRMWYPHLSIERQGLSLEM